MNKTSSLFLSLVLVLLTISSCKQNQTEESSESETEEQLVQRALEIHKRVLTLDTHADTPLRMIEPGFDMAERHDPNESKSGNATHLGEVADCVGQVAQLRNLGDARGG